MSWKLVVCVACFVTIGLRWPRQLSVQLCEHVFPKASTSHIVYASAHVPEDTIRKCIPSEVSVWDLDTNALAARIQEISYWIERVNVARRFPNTLIITVTEYNLIGVCDSRAVDASGQVLKLPAHCSPVDLPFITGNVNLASSAQLQTIKKVSAIAKQRKLQVQSLHKRAYGGGWDVNIIHAGQIVCIRLPAVGAPEALTRACKWLDQNTTPVKAVDLRCNAPVIAWTSIKSIACRGGNVRHI